MDTVLKLFKMDLGITHELRDELFSGLLTSCKSELEGKGIALDLDNNAEDQMLLSDFAVWRYRKRTEDVPLSQNLLWRIRNRKAAGRLGNAT